MEGKNSNAENTKNSLNIWITMYICKFYIVWSLLTVVLLFIPFPKGKCVSIVVTGNLLHLFPNHTVCLHLRKYIKGERFY